MKLKVDQQLYIKGLKEDGFEILFLKNTNHN